MSIFQFNPYSPVIILDVTLQQEGNKKKVRMALDTGSTYTIISRNVAESLGLNIYSNDSVDIFTASVLEKVPLLKIDGNRVLNKEVKTVTIAIHDLPARSGVDGLLGLSFLKHCDLRINFKEGWLELN